ncbi:hypothetical protein, partial [Cronobacter sakazakii]|uniref:hypothetical protein n=1 Tax=Cronobacter sakazakii TaxID=28141 RepID=UPI000D52289B
MCIRGRGTALGGVPVNGKVGRKITVAAGGAEGQVRGRGAPEHLVAEFLAGVAGRKVIYVPG